MGRELKVGGGGRRDSLLVSEFSRVGGEISKFLAGKRWGGNLPHPPSKENHDDG